MLHSVTVQILLSCKALSTRRALEGTFACVGQHVAMDICWVVSRIVALAARVLLLHRETWLGPGPESQPAPSKVPL